MGKKFSDELDRIEQTLAWCANQPAVDAWSPDCRADLIAIGSGGSFTAADAGARLWSKKYSRIALAMTPLEYLQRVGSIEAHHALLISAEGKNADIRAATAAALELASNLTLLTFRVDSPAAVLMSQCKNARILAFDSIPWEKDGYLATNSLIASVGILGKGLGDSVDWAAAAARLRIARDRFRSSPLLTLIAEQRRLLVFASHRGAAAAIDLESKFSEAAFGFVQKVDLRQFAHGRHIQLADESRCPPIIAFVSPDELDLWAATRSLLPNHVVHETVLLPGGLSNAVLQGLAYVFALVEALGQLNRQDPGQPQVPAFARQIHALTPTTWPSRNEPGLDQGSRRDKVAALRRVGATKMEVANALEAFLLRMSRAHVKGLVLDFDGTCCETHLRKFGARSEVIEQFNRLLEVGLTVAFASGRGDSLHTVLRHHIRQDHWPRVLLGCHSGTSCVRLSDAWAAQPLDPAIAEARERLTSMGVNIERGYSAIRAHAGQLTIESPEPERMLEAFLAATAEAQRQGGCRVFQSSHSIDFLAPTAGKLNVVKWLQTEIGSEDVDSIVRIGDRGEPGGNDFELLSSGLSLSVDGASPSLESAWLFELDGSQPSLRTARYLQAIKEVKPSECRFDADVLARWQRQSVELIDAAYFRRR